MFSCRCCESLVWTAATWGHRDVGSRAEPLACDNKYRCEGFISTNRLIICRPLRHLLNTYYFFVFANLSLQSIILPSRPSFNTVVHHFLLNPSLSAHAHTSLLFFIPLCHYTPKAVIFFMAALYACVLLLMLNLFCSASFVFHAIYLLTCSS